VFLILENIKGIQRVLMFPLAQPTTQLDPLNSPTCCRQNVLIFFDQM